MRSGGRNDDSIQTFPGYISAFQYIISKDVKRGECVLAGTITSNVRMARVIPTNMVRRSRAIASCNSSLESSK